jgi:hypothetical protein
MILAQDLSVLCIWASNSRKASMVRGPANFGISACAQHAQLTATDHIHTSGKGIAVTSLTGT